MAFDLVIRNGRVITAADVFVGDIGISDGKIAALGSNLGAAARDIDAGGLCVMPGGVDAHCHVAEPDFLGAVMADDFASATRAAACGGTTTLISFANQLPHATLRQSIDDYHARANGRALIDYAFHVILSTVTPEVLRDELPRLIERGYRSYKVFMTYPGYQLADDVILQVMQTAGRRGGTVLVHAENGHCIHWLTQRLEEAGRTALADFATAAPVAVEREATHRAITLAQLAEARIMVVHVSSAEALEQIEWGQRRGIGVLAETCPQYLLETAAHPAGDEWLPARTLCSPPPRGRQDAERLWSGLERGSFRLLSSDHCAYRYAGRDGKRVSAVPDFRHVPPGVPGLETRLPLLYDSAVLQGRMTAQQFVALTATNPARTYGLYPRKGSLMPGADADVVLWDDATPVAIRHADLHDACDYTPYEGQVVGAWPVTTLSRGEVVWDRGWVSQARGRGRFVAQGPHD